MKDGEKKIKVRPWSHLKSGSLDVKKIKIKK